MRLSYSQINFLLSWIKLFLIKILRKKKQLNNFFETNYNGTIYSQMSNLFRTNNFLICLRLWNYFYEFLNRSINLKFINKNEFSFFCSNFVWIFLESFMRNFWCVILNVFYFDFLKKFQLCTKFSKNFRNSKLINNNNLYFFLYTKLVRID